MVLIGKEMYHNGLEMSNTLIFNELWDEICEGEADNDKGENDSLPTKSIVDKELPIWENNDILSCFNL